MKPPIADPNSGVPIDAEFIKFSYNFWKFYLGNFFGIFVVGGPICLSMVPQPISSRHLGHADHRQSQYLLFLLFILIFGSLVATLSSTPFPARASAEVLRGPKFWGGHQDVMWAQIDSVKYWWLIFPYAVISPARGGHKIWLPLVLKDMPAFTRAVEEHTAPDNPLRLFLQKRGY